jgi:small subunit ribosomal protein S35
MSLYLREMTRSTSMLVRQISTTSRLDIGSRTYDATTILEDEKKGVFRVMQIGKPKEDRAFQRRRGGPQGPPPPPRSASMTPDQSWGSVWPAPRTFHPATVPLPVRQGVIQTKAQVVPSKYANAELMKIPNFLHLTPPVISTHCSAISKFCTAWPKGLETEEDIDKNFPITVTTSDHLNSNSSIRDRRARIVQLRLNLDSLPLDTHARDKMVRLVGDR